MVDEGRRGEETKEHLAEFDDEKDIDEHDSQGVQLRKKTNISPTSSVTSPPCRTGPYVHLGLKYSLLVVIVLAFVVYGMQLHFGLEALDNLIESTNWPMVSGLTKADRFAQKNSQWLSFSEVDLFTKGEKFTIWTRLLNEPEVDHFDKENISDLIRSRNCVIVGAVFGILVTLMAAVAVWSEIFWLCLIVTALEVIFSICLAFKVTTIYEIVVTLALTFILIVYTVCLKVIVRVYVPVGVVQI